MILDLKKIFSNGQKSVAFQHNVDLSKTKVNYSYPFVSPVVVKGTVIGKDGSAQLELNVSFDFSIPCDRCAGQINKNYEYSFSHILVASCENKDADKFIEVHNQQLDLDKLVREDILLELPSKFLCREDCKGICPICGKNLNEGPCDCHICQMDSRLNVLKDLLH